MKRYLVILPMLALVVTFGACGGSSTTNDNAGAASFTDLNSLPKATDPVYSAATGDIVVPVKALVTKAAGAGMKFSNMKQSMYNAQSSMAMCEIANNVREIFNASSQADLVDCYVSKVSDYNSVDRAAIEDGQPHIITLAGADVNAPSRIKMVIQKDASGSITKFEMFTCKIDQDTQVEAQSEYLKKEVANGELSIVAIGNSSDSSWTGSHMVTVSGPINADGHFTSKTISLKNKGESTSGTHTDANWNEGVFDQYADNFIFSGYMKGTFEESDSQFGGTGTYSSAGYAKGQLLNAASGFISEAAMGDGAVSVHMVNTFTPNSGPYNWNDDRTEVHGWAADTTLSDDTVVDPADGETWYSKVENGIVPAATGTDPTVKATADEVVIVFAADQTWDCSGTPEYEFTMPPDMVDDSDQECGQKYSLGHEWVNCYGVINEGM